MQTVSCFVQIIILIKPTSTEQEANLGSGTRPDRTRQSHLGVSAGSGSQPDPAEPLGSGSIHIIIRLISALF